MATLMGKTWSKRTSFSSSGILYPICMERWKECYITYVNLPNQGLPGNLVTLKNYITFSAVTSSDFFGCSEGRMPRQRYGQRLCLTWGDLTSRSCQVISWQVGFQLVGGWPTPCGKICESQLGSWLNSQYFWRNKNMFRTTHQIV